MAAPSTSPGSSPSRLPAFLQQTKAELKAKFIDLEWQQRHRLLQGSQQPTSPADPPSPWSRLSGEQVTGRNRYMNVEPYASNRVKLKVAEGMNDYINASPIHLGRRRYIATQGPKDSSVNHFYRMLASEARSPAVVVMLTQTHEAGREKCFQYYPLSAQDSPLPIPPDAEIRDGFQGEVVLESVEEDARSSSQIRRMRLRTSSDGGGGASDAQEMEIQHLLFSAWPDFLVPEGEDRVALIELIRLSARLNHEQEPADVTGQTQQANGAVNGGSETSGGNPRIIHCSAGVGRSGTFIALDYLLSLLNDGQLDDIPPEKDPIADLVDLLRQQRMMMVQGEPQFHFLYEVLREQMLARIQHQD